MKNNQVPEQYMKLWQYMTDSAQAISDSRINGMLEEIFVGKVVDQKDLLKNNIKTMKLRARFDLRHDSWMQGLTQQWETTFKPELFEMVKDIKATPDIKDRAPKMREFLRDIRVSTTPMTVLGMMEEAYRQNKESLVDPILNDPDDTDYSSDNGGSEDAGPGYLRRAGRAAGGRVKSAVSAGVYGLLHETKEMSALMSAGSKVFGLAKAAKKTFGKGSKTGSSKLTSSVKGLFGMGGGRNKVSSKQTDFTPREEQLEGGQVLSVLERIEANTAALLDKFCGNPNKEKKDGILGTLLNTLSGLPRMLMSSLKILTIPLLGALAALSPILSNIVKVLGGLAAKLGVSLIKMIPSILGVTGATAAVGVVSALTPGNAFQDTDKIARDDANVGRGAIPTTPDDVKKDARKRAYDVFANSTVNGQKLTPAQIKGMFISTASESGWDPKAVNKESKALGLFQFLGSRKEEYLKYASARSKQLGLDIMDPAIQAEFKIRELNTTEKRAAKKLLAAKTVEEAAKVVKFDYERPVPKELKGAEREAFIAKTTNKMFEHKDNETAYVNQLSEGLFTYNTTAPEMSPEQKLTFDLRNKKMDERLIKKSMNETKPMTKLSPEDMVNLGISDPLKISPKQSAPKAPTITPQSGDKSSSVGNTNINVASAAPNSGTEGGNTRTGHYNPDFSYLQQVKDNTSLAYS